MELIIKDGVLKGCRLNEDETDVVIPDGVTQIGDNAFFVCQSLKAITLPDSVTEIGYSAFFGCQSLKAITLPDSVTEIGEKAFADCTSLESVTIPDSVTEIGEKAFADCTSLESVTIPDSVTKICDSAFDNCTSLESVTIPDSVTEIDYCAFSSCTSLKSVTIPDSVTEIGEQAFADCTSLESVTMPDSVTEIGWKAFTYCESLKTVTIPDSVREISGGAFSYCKSLESVTIPDSVTEIRDWAFADCTSLESVTIPDSVTKIGYRAFYNCESLESVTMPDSIAYIASGAFDNTPFLKKCIQDDMEVFGSCFYKYIGNDSTFVIPDGITVICDSAFENCTSLTSVTIPDSVTEIGAWAFCGCSELELRVPTRLIDNISQSGFSGCKTVYGFEGKCCTAEPLSDDWAVTSIVRSDEDIANIVIYQNAKIWKNVVETHIKKFGADGVIIAFDSMFSSDKSVDTKLGKKIADFVVSYASGLSDDALNTAHQFMSRVKLKKGVLALESDAFISKRLKGTSSTGKTKSKKSASRKPQSTNPIEELVEANWVTSPITADLKKSIKKGVKYTGSDEVSSPEAVIFVLNAYLSQMDDTPKHYGDYKTGYVNTHIDEIADKVAAALDRDMLMSILDDSISSARLHTNEYYIPYCRYAGGEEISKLISEMSKWKDWYRYGQIGRKNIIIARGGLLLSDTREAMTYFDKMNLLDHYAEIRGTTADVIRDTILADFGLESDGTKTYDLGSTTITAQLSNELTISLYDNNAGKVVKSLPKKGSDPALYESASAHLSEMKKNLKKVAKSRNDKLFEAFLKGNSFIAASWKKSYTENPLLRQIASLLVWCQGKTTFTLSESGAVDSSGAVYTIDDSEPIILAHPMEMEESDVKAWQKYFSDKKLKQPFLQVWEPVADEAFIEPDRYDGIEIPFNFFRGSEKHGISIEDYDFHNEISIDMPDCSFDTDFTVWHRHELPEMVVIKNFHIEKLTRRNNHIIALLDRWTVAKRIADDDTSIFQFIGNATLAQLTYYIDIAGQNNATNCMAELLELKNKNYPDFDPMDEYSLD